MNTPPAQSKVQNPLDLELIAQRILKLSEIATLEHLETLARTQADRLLELAQQYAE